MLLQLLLLKLLNGKNTTNKCQEFPWEIKEAFCGICIEGGKIIQFINKSKKNRIRVEKEFTIDEKAFVNILVWIPEILHYELILIVE